MSNLDPLQFETNQMLKVVEGLLLEGKLQKAENKSTSSYMKCGCVKQIIRDIKCEITAIRGKITLKLNTNV